MLPNEAIRALVREDKAHQIYSIIQVGGASGMRTMNQSLYEQYRRGAITYDDALSHSSKPDDLKNTFKRAGMAGSGKGRGGGAR
jgi:twitching motility protein PilT